MEKYLLIEIEKVRKELVLRGSQLGFNHPIVLKLSQKLDRLHTKFVKIQISTSYNQKQDEGSPVLEDKSILMCANL